MPGFHLYDKRKEESRGTLFYIILKTLIVSLLLA
jgi:hypothetical protein